MTFKLAECSIKMTALLEYLDLKLNTHIYLFIYCFTAQVLEVYRTPGPTACSRTQMLQSQYIASWLSLLNSLAFYSDSSLLLQGVSMMTTSTTDRFSAHYSERLQYNWVDFLFANSISSFKKLNETLGTRFSKTARSICIKLGM